MICRKIIFLSLFVIYLSSLHGTENTLNQSIAILNRANLIQLARIRIATENLANIDSISSNKNASPYQRKLVIVRNKYDSKISSNVLFYQILPGKMPFNSKYQPFHPYADSYGYVKYPNILPEIEKADFMEAQKNYEANLSAIEMSNGMIQKTLDILK